MKIDEIVSHHSHASRKAAVPYTWHGLPRPGGNEARFEVNGIGYRVDFVNRFWGAEADPVTTLQYSIDRQSMQKLNRRDMTSPTNLGHQFPVMSTILAVINEWFSSHHPQAVYFYDGDHIASRARFYNRIANMLIRSYDYQLSPDLDRLRREHGNQSVWLLQKPRQAGPGGVSI